MTDDAVIDVMEVLHSCRCCLRRPPDKDLTRPYSHLGKTEIYSDIIEQCFDIRLSLDNDDECGICNPCVDRLRDASDFKMQVHRSQAELEARLDRVLSAMNETEIKPEMVEDNVANDDLVSDVGPAGESAVVEQEVANDDIHITFMDSAAVVRVPAQSISARATEQLATACSMRLEGLRSDESPRTAQTPLKSSDHNTPDQCERDLQLNNQIDYGNYCSDFEAAQESPFIHNDIKKKTLFCHVCERLFEDKKSLKMHMLLHEGDKHYSCDICKKRFIEKYILKHHIFRVHMEHFNCKFCNKLFFYKSELFQHMDRHKEEEPAKVSMRQFPQDSKVNSHTGDEENRYFCDLCKQGFLLKSVLIHHMRTHEKEEANSRKKVTTLKSYARDVCNKQFVHKPHLRRHFKTHAVERASCHVCKKTFKYPGYVKIHMRSHTGEKPYECDKCNERFIQKTNLKSHNCVTANYSFFCAVCKKGFQLKNTLVTHMRVHTRRKTYNCEVCNKQFAYKTNLNVHLATHSAERPYSCEVCKKTFKYQNYVKMHMRSHTGEKPYECGICHKWFAQKSNSVYHKCVTANNRFFCDLCKKGFQLKCLLKKHMRIHTGQKPYACDVCNKQFALKIGLNSHLKSHSAERPYSCQICKRTFKYQQNVKIHMRTHTGEKPYECGICKGRFARKTCLRYHKCVAANYRFFCDVCKKGFQLKCMLINHIRVHTGQKPYTCDVCNKQFAHGTGLKYHFASHSSERPYSCQVCKKTFKYQSNLKIHMRTHTGEKPYECGICKRRFARKSCLRYHKCVAANYRFFCDVCKKGFQLKCVLINHMRIHTGQKPYSCEVCNTQFAYKASLNIHLATHSAERPYSCQVCKKTFKYQNSLRIHMRTHTGEKPYECGVCNKRFTQKSYLIKHKCLLCELCNKGLQSKSALRKHMHDVHTRQNPHNYEKRCELNTSINSHLTIHSTEGHAHESGEAFSCDKCGKQFTTKNGLMSHVNRDMGVYRVISGP